MGAVNDARRRVGRFVRRHEGRIDDAAELIRSATGAVLERAAGRREPDGGSSPPPPASTPPAAAPSPARAPTGASPAVDRAADAARREIARPSRSAAPGQGPVSRVREEAERLESGVSRIGNETEVEQLVRENTKAELMRRAHELEIKGRSRMTKQQLAIEIAARG
jgi:hypothetical protein